MSYRREVGDILTLVSNWSPEERADLARELLESLPRKSGLAPAPRDTLRHASGILRRPGPPPTDEEVERVRWEAMKEKHLR